MSLETSGLSGLEPGSAFRGYATEDRLYPKLKRAFDIVLVLAAAPAVLIVFLLASAAIYLLEGGPIFFVQERVGKAGRVFRMIKLRTMVQEDLTEPRATSKSDPRVTRLGYFLRQSHIDELPQVLNILMGDMSL